MSKPIYNYDEETRVTTCTLQDKTGNKVAGFAKCHPQDEYSQRIGEYIATIRAEIKYYKLIRKNELSPQIKILRHLHSCITSSNKYSTSTPESKLILSTYKRYKEDYAVIGEIIEELENALKLYLKTREEFISNEKSGQNKTN